MNKIVIQDFSPGKITTTNEKIYKIGALIQKPKIQIKLCQISMNCVKKIKSQDRATV